MIFKKFFFTAFTLLIIMVQTLLAQEIALTSLREVEAEFNYPTDICGDDNGNIFILDAMNERVVFLRANGEVTDIKPQRETIYKAVGISMIDGDLWIADTPRSRLLKLNLNGRVSEIVRLDHQTEPVDLIGVGKNMVMTDRRNHTITVLDENQKEKYYWGRRGEGSGEFINPGFLALAPENRLIISDILNRRVVSLSQSGRYPQIIAKPGVQRGQIFRPKGLDLDSQNRIWVVDGYTGSLQAFSISGKFLGIATTAGKPIHLSAPMGVYIDKQDQIWVVESYSNKVSVWKAK